MDQGVRYVVRIDGINEAKSGLMSMESSASRAEASIASLNSTLAGLGIGVGLHELINFGKDAVQGAADYETAMKRIKFASADLIDAAKNQSFILGEVDKFKIPLQSATDAYGKFLAMLNGSGIAGDRIRSLHDDLLLIGKVKGLGDGQMDAAVMNLGKMLESGSLDARHFRPLEQQLSGIGAFVAKELGITVHQLAILRNKGKMTTIDPQVLLTAIEKQAASLKKFLPESTTTIQSQINDLDNSWMKFKNDLVFENITELRELFETLKSGVSFLKAHEDTIIFVGKTVLEVAGIWLGYKTTMLLVNGAFTAYNAVAGVFVGNEIKAIAQTELRTAAITEQMIAVNALTAALERQMAIQAGGSGLVGYGGMAAAESTALTTTGVAGGALISTVSSVLAAAAVVAAIGFVVNEVGTHYGWFGDTQRHGNLSIGDKLNATEWGASAESLKQNLDNFGGTNAWNYSDRLKGILRDPENEKLYKQLSEAAKDYGSMDAIQFDPKGNIINYFNFLAQQKKSWNDLSDFLGGYGYEESQIIPGVPGTAFVQKDARSASLFDYAKNRASKSASEKIAPPNDKVTGQRVITYNIQIDRMGTIDKVEVNNSKDFNYDDFKKRLGEALQDVLNDEQIRAGN